MNAPSKTKQLTKDQYHAMTDVISSSMLKQLRRDVTVYHDTYEETDPDKQQPPFVETKPMETGSILHSIVLDRQPLRSIVGVYPEYDSELAEIKALTGPKRDKLDTYRIKKYAKICKTPADVFATAKGGAALNEITSRAPENVIGESGVMSSKAAKRYRDSQPDYRYFVKRLGEMNTGKTASFETLRAATAAIQSTEYYKIFESDQVIRETPLFWSDELTGMKCRCCPDFLLIADRHAFIWDLKITEFASDFGKQMNNLDYHIQDEHYTEGVRANHDIDTVSYTFLACKPTYPFHVCEYKFKDVDRTRIKADYQATMDLLKRLKESGDWSHPATQGTNEVELRTYTTKFVN